MSEQASIVGAHPFLRTMPPRHTERLAEIAQHVRFPSEHRLFEEREIARKFWLIDAGQVAVDALVPGDGRVIIEMLGRGDLLGLSWLHPPYQWQYGAVTAQPMQAFEFDAAGLRPRPDLEKTRRAGGRRGQQTQNHTEGGRRIRPASCKADQCG
jgi:hypothetical protein